MTFDQWMHASLDRVESALEHYLPGTEIAPAKLHEAKAMMSQGSKN